MDLAEFNAANTAASRALLGACLDIREWVDEVDAGRPFADLGALRACAAGATERITWPQVAGALARHPRIGEKPRGAGTDARWSGSEQSGVRPDDIGDLAAGNAAYEARFGYIFLICATGLSGEQMLAELRRRLTHDPATEQPVVIGELRKIAALRLAKAVTS